MRIGIVGFVVAFGLQGGCSADLQNPENAPSIETAEDSLNGPPSDTVGATGSADSGAGYPTTAYYALNLGFELVGGTAEANGQIQYPVLSVELYSDADEPEVVCRHEVPIVGDVVEQPFPDNTAVPLIVWWQLDLDVGVPDDLCPDWPARTWWIGLGPYDRRLDPMMAERGSLGFDVYGLYLQESLTEGVYIVGMAGTNEMISGATGLTVVDGPLPDGQYQAESLLLMSLD